MFAADVYWKSTGVLELGKSAGKGKTVAAILARLVRVSGNRGEIGVVPGSDGGMRGEGVGHPTC